MSATEARLREAAFAVVRQWNAYRDDPRSLTRMWGAMEDLVAALAFPRSDGEPSPEGSQPLIREVVGNGDGTMNVTLDNGEVRRITEAEYVAWPRQGKAFDAAMEAVVNREHITNGTLDCWCHPYRDSEEPSVIIHRREGSA